MKWVFSCSSSCLWWLVDWWQTKVRKRGKMRKGRIHVIHCPGVFAAVAWIGRKWCSLPKVAPPTLFCTLTSSQFNSNKKSWKEPTKVLIANWYVSLQSYHRKAVQSRNITKFQEQTSRPALNLNLQSSVQSSLRVLQSSEQEHSKCSLGVEERVQWSGKPASDSSLHQKTNEAELTLKRLQH